MNAGILAQALKDEGSKLLSWWQGQLFELALAALAHTLPGVGRRLQLFPHLKGCEVWLQSGGRRQPLLSILPNAEGASLPETLQHCAGLPTVIGLPMASILTIDCRLPTAAEASLDSAMALRLQREIPLLSHHYRADWLIVARERAAAQIVVRAWIARVRDIDRHQAHCASWGLRLERIGLDAGDRQVSRNFLAAHAQQQNAQSAKPARWLVGLGGGLMASLLIAVVSQWTYERLHVARQERALQTAAHEIRQHSEQLAHAWQPAEALESVMLEPDASDALLALTEVVPLSAWVYDLNLEAKPRALEHVKFIGFALGADDLVRALEKQGAYQNVTLLNSLPDAAEKPRERFNITADWRPHDLPAVPAAAGTQASKLQAGP